jgi:hypothetical protein
MHVKKANCGASVKSSSKPKKMNSGGFMKIGDNLQALDINKKRENMGMSSGGMAEKKREEEAKKKGNYKKGEVVEAKGGKHMYKKKKPKKKY